MIGFWQLFAFVAFLLVYGLAIIMPFIWHMNKRLQADKDREETDRQRSEACHSFQRELNENTMIGFQKTYEALNLNSQVLTAAMERISPPPPKDQRKDSDP